MILLDTNVFSESLRKTPAPAFIDRLIANDVELALPTVSIAEIAYGIRKVAPDQRAVRQESGLDEWRRRFAGRIFALTESAALAHGDIMGDAARLGLPMSTPDGMIAAITRANAGRLATRNHADFTTTGLEVVSPWDF